MNKGTSAIYLDSFPLALQKWKLASPYSARGGLVHDLTCDDVPEH